MDSEGDLRSYVADFALGVSGLHHQVGPSETVQDVRVNVRGVSRVGQVPEVVLREDPSSSQSHASGDSGGTTKSGVLGVATSEHSYVSADDFHVLFEFAYVLFELAYVLLQHIYVLTDLTYIFTDLLEVILHSVLAGFDRVEPPVGGLDEAIDLRSEVLHFGDELGEPFGELEKVLGQEPGAQGFYPLGVFVEQAEQVFDCVDGGHGLNFVSGSLYQGTG